MNNQELGNSLFSPYTISIELIYTKEMFTWISSQSSSMIPLYYYTDNNLFYYIPIISIFKGQDNMLYLRFIAKDGTVGGFAFNNKEVQNLKYYPGCYYSTEPNGVGVRFMILDESGYRIIEKEQSDKYINQFKEALK